jgi:multicomponent K+:H+ antiporter subunit E
MTRLIPYPLLAASLLLMWLLLTQSFSPGQIALGAAVSLLATASTAALHRPNMLIRSWRKVAELAAIVVADVIRSNIAVARIALSFSRKRHSSFIRLQLQLRDQQALAILALILTATPGTAWIQFNRTDGMLLIHVFDLVDEEAWARLLKSRYERLLMEIFES